MKIKSILLIIIFILSSCTQTKKNSLNIYLDCSSLNDTSEVVAWSLGYVSYSPGGESFSQNKNGIKIYRQSYDISTNNSTMFIINNNVKDIRNNDLTFFFGFEIIDNKAKVIVLDNKSFIDIEEHKDDIIEMFSKTSGSCKVLTEDEFSKLSNNSDNRINWTNEFGNMKSIDFFYDNSFSQIYLTLVENNEYYVSIYGFDTDTMTDINIDYNDTYVRVFNNFYKLLNFKNAMNDDVNDYYLEINDDNAKIYLYDLNLRMLMPIIDLSK